MTVAQGQLTRTAASSRELEPVTLSVRYETYGRPLTLETLTDQLGTLGWIMALSKAVAVQERRPDPAASVPLAEERVGETTLLRVRYESPVDVVLALNAAVLM